jgi:L-asparaginase II
MDSDVLVEVIRGGMVESRHRGGVVVLNADGSVLRAMGDVSAPILPRSSLKPLQAVGMLRSGLDLRDQRLALERLALACASHSGERRHARLAQEILATYGLTPHDLRNTPDLPLDPMVRERHVRNGGSATRLHANCSGKHAAMLATCVLNGWPRGNYLDADHPLQTRLRSTVEDLAHERIMAETVDGCGAPAFALSLTGLARAYATVARSGAGTPEAEVAAAMREYPWAIGGRRREVSRLIAGVPGLIAKDAAEGVAAAAMPDGRAVAVKIDDGDPLWRATFRALTAGLRLAGVRARILDELATVPVTGHGRLVGRVQATFARDVLSTAPSAAAEK